MTTTEKEPENLSFSIQDPSGKGIGARANPESQTVVVKILGFSKTVDPSFVMTGQEAARLAAALKHLASQVRS